MDHWGCEMTEDDRLSLCSHEADDNSTTAEREGEQNEDNQKSDDTQQDESISNALEWRIVEGSKDELHHSFDHVLDGLPSSNTMSLSKLCHLCQELFDDLERFTWNHEDYDPILLDVSHVQGHLALKQSAENGCSLCAMLLHTILRSWRKDEMAKYIAAWKKDFGGIPFPGARVYVYPGSASVERPIKFFLDFPKDPCWGKTDILWNFGLRMEAQLIVAPKICE